MTSQVIAYIVHTSTSPVGSSLASVTNDFLPKNMAIEYEFARRNRHFDERGLFGMVAKILLSLMYIE